MGTRGPQQKVNTDNRDYKNRGFISINKHFSLKSRARMQKQRTNKSMVSSDMVRRKASLSGGKHHFFQSQSQSSFIVNYFACPGTTDTTRHFLHVDIHIDIHIEIHVQQHKFSYFLMALILTLSGVDHPAQYALAPHTHTRKFKAGRGRQLCQHLIF